MTSFVSVDCAQFLSKKMLSLDILPFSQNIWSIRLSNVQEYFERLEYLKWVLRLIPTKALLDISWIFEQNYVQSEIV